jgi:hypothetical protein
VGGSPRGERSRVQIDAELGFFAAGERTALDIGVEVSFFGPGEGTEVDANVEARSFASRPSPDRGPSSTIFVTIAWHEAT